MRLRKILILSILPVFTAAFSQNITINPPEYDTVLYNPGCGVETFHQYDGGMSSATYPKSTIAYQRFYWSEIEPTRGAIAFNRFDDMLTQSRLHGQRAAFRIMCVDDGLKIPQWLADTVGGAYYGTVYWPNWDNPKFMNEVERLMNALGARYNGNIYLNHVDIGFLGCWGEENSACISSGTPPMWSSATAERNIDIHKAAFPDVPLVTLYAYNIRPGMGWRNDCLGDKNWQDNWVQTTIANAHPDAWQTGMICQEVCYTIGQWSANYGYDLAGFQGVMNKALSWHTSAINPKSSPIPSAWMPTLIETIKYLGYRIKLTQLVHAGAVSPGKKAFVQMTFQNEGVAPPYHSYSLLAKLQPAIGNALVFPISGVNVKTWIPGTYTIQDSLLVPNTAPAGQYALKIGFAYPDSTKPVISLANYGRDSAGWYNFSTMSVGNASVNEQVLHGGKFLNLQAAPDPFQQGAVIRFSLPQRYPFKLNIHSLQGKPVRRLVDESRGPGAYAVKWDGRDMNGQLVPAGAYLVQTVLNGQQGSAARICLSW